MGEFARRQAADAPTRTVAAAKSWLAHSRVDRHQAILPWDAPSGRGRRSAPWKFPGATLNTSLPPGTPRYPDAPLAAQQGVVLTVPASFDASARELTREAALAAGLPAELTLLEEPQAALYAWLADSSDRWREDPRRRRHPAGLRHRRRHD